MTDLLELAKRTLAELAGSATGLEKIGAGPSLDPDVLTLVHARNVLNRAGVHKFALNGEVIVGIWSDHDSLDIRAALFVLEADRLTIRYLDGASIPIQYKLRRVEGESVPLNVLAEMERNPAEPWTGRDQMLNQMGWCPDGVGWSEWKAAALNRCFLRLGTSGQPGRIAAATVGDGEK